METLSSSAFVPLLGGVLLFAVWLWVLNLIHKRGVRHYERMVDNAYVERFERRALVARSLHPRLAQTMQRTKSVIDQVRARFPDGPETEAALNQVSEWLEGAAGDSDRALRSLDARNTTPFHHGYIARGPHVDTKNNSHHDR
jgi:signal transduction histidine kinase